MNSLTPLEQLPARVVKPPPTDDSLPAYTDCPRPVAYTGAHPEGGRGVLHSRSVPITGKSRPPPPPKTKTKTPTIPPLPSLSLTDPFITLHSPSLALLLACGQDDPLPPNARQHLPHPSPFDTSRVCPAGRPRVPPFKGFRTRMERSHRRWDS